jgi:hypothetical protein
VRLERLYSLVDFERNPLASKGFCVVMRGRAGPIGTTLFPPFSPCRVPPPCTTLCSLSRARARDGTVKVFGGRLSLAPVGHFGGSPSQSLTPRRKLI